MSTQIAPPLNVGHPSPHRGRVGLAALFFGVAAAPIGWSVPLLFSVSLSGHACYPRDRLLAAPLWGGLWLILLAFSLAGVALNIMGGFISWRSWQRSRDERPGSAHELLDGGDGRTRFMAMAGMLVSAVFFVGLVFGTTALWLVPLCGQ